MILTRSSAVLFLLACSALTSCETMRIAANEFQGKAETGVVWMSPMPQMKEPNKRANTVYLDVRDLAGTNKSAEIQKAVAESMLKERNLRIEKDPERADYKIGVVLRNLAKGRLTDPNGYTDESKSGVAYTLVTDITIAERVPEAIVVTTEVGENSQTDEALFLGDGKSFSSNTSDVGWVRQNKTFYAVHRVRARIWSESGGYFTSKDSNVNSMVDEIARSLPQVLPAVQS